MSADLVTCLVLKMSLLRYSEVLQRMRPLEHTKIGLIRKYVFIMRPKDIYIDC